MIEPRYGVLQTLFADRVFRIPHYQRFYSWQKRQREDLFADIRKLAREPTTRLWLAFENLARNTPSTKPSNRV
jgi:Protein of unknown function DUF262